MSDSASLLDLLNVNQANKEVSANNLFNAMSMAALFARNSVTSVGLTWGYYGGVARNVSNTPVKVANGTVPLTANVTNYISHTYGAINVTTTPPTNWPGPLAGGAIALYSVVCGGTGVLSWVDWRNMGADPIVKMPKRIGTVAYSATPTLDWGAYDVIRITLTGNVTTFNHTGGDDGQNCTLEILQDSTGSHTITGWGTQIRASADLGLPVLSTTANKMDKIGFQYNAGAGKYDLVAVLKGF